jgi:hypothetical protein
MSKNFNPGEIIWIVERDETGYASGVSGSVFLAELAGAVIVTPKIYGRDSLEEIMAYHIEETAEDYDTDLSVFPAQDCYRCKHEAMEARYNETED